MAKYRCRWVDLSPEFVFEVDGIGLGKWRFKYLREGSQVRYSPYVVRKSELEALEKKMRARKGAIVWMQIQTLSGGDGTKGSREYNELIDVLHGRSFKRWRWSVPPKEAVLLCGHCGAANTYREEQIRFVERLLEKHRMADEGPKVHAGG